MEIVLNKKDPYIKLKEKEYKKLTNGKVKGLITSSPYNSKEPFATFLCVNNKVRAKCICSNVFGFKPSTNIKDVTIDAFMAVEISNHSMTEICEQSKNETLYCWVIKEIEEYEKTENIPDSVYSFYASIF